MGGGTNIPNIDLLGSEPYLISIGENVYFSGYTSRILTHDGSISKTYDMGIAPKRFDVFGKVEIGDNCFIGDGVTIMRGVNIGRNCIIGAKSVVTRDVPDNSVVCGVPARVVCTVSEFYYSKQIELEDTIGWDSYKKREYLEQRFSKNLKK